MSFMPQASIQREVQPQGMKSAKIAIVGDINDNFALRSLRPFTGADGTVLEQCLHAAQLIRGECYITTLAKGKESEGHLANIDKQKKFKGFTQAGHNAVTRLHEELSECEANVIVACGNLSFAALTGVWGVAKYRGYVFESLALPSIRKVIPIFHPRDAIFGTYIRRHLISSDLSKARLESKSRELVRPDRQLIYRFDRLSEVLEWLEYYETVEVLACDIEVINYAVSCISFSADPGIACVVPIAAGWTLDEELQIWRAIQRVLGNPNSRKILQNGIFDQQFLLAENGVVIRGRIEDTMLGHSVCFPELQKSLGFLGSLYCGTQEYWKDKVKFNNIKEDS